MHNNVNFNCVQCGNCCMAHGHVYLTTKDRVVLSYYLGLSATKFTKQYCQKTHGDYHLMNPDADCCFLKDKRCSVYKARPEQCQTWPFWPENFENGQIKASMTSYCRGIQEKHFDEK